MLELPPNQYLWRVTSKNRINSNNLLEGEFNPVDISQGTALAQWLRCCATNRKVAGSIPASVSGFFIDIKSFRSNYGPAVD